MSYTKKIKEYGRLARICYYTGQYNSAVGRFYYAAFLTIKEIAHIDDAIKVRHGKILGKYFKFLHENSYEISEADRLALKDNWSILYNNRTRADYKTVEISKVMAKKSLIAYRIVEEVLWNFGKKRSTK